MKINAAARLTQNSNPNWNTNFASKSEYLSLLKTLGAIGISDGTLIKESGEWAILIKRELLMDKVVNWLKANGFKSYTNKVLDSTETEAYMKGSSLVMLDYHQDSGFTVQLIH